MGQTTTATITASPVAQIADGLRIFREPGDIVELRALEFTKDGQFPHTQSGFFDFDHIDEMARLAGGYLRWAKNVYFTINPLKPEILARCANRIEKAKTGSLAADENVLCRRWMLIDADPVRLAHISATDCERAFALGKIQEVRDFLRAQGWPGGVTCDSGNGYHLLFKVNLPAEDGGLVRRFLEAMHERFTSDKAKIDTAVFNPSRITKCYGTVAKKGDHVPDRPHRVSSVLEVAPDLAVVPREMIEALCPKKDEQTKSAQPSGQKSGRRHKGGFDPLSRAWNYIDAIPRSISGQNGHGTLFNAACRLVKMFGLSDDDAMGLLSRWNVGCQPPWSDAELLHKVKEARAKGKDEPATETYQSNGRTTHDAHGPTPAAEPLDLLDAFRRGEWNKNEAPDDPHLLASNFLKKKYRVKGNAEGQSVALRFWNEEFFKWNGACYLKAPDAEIKAELVGSIKEDFDELDALLRSGPPKEGEERKPTKPVSCRLIADVMQALKSLCLVSSRIMPPAWIEPPAWIVADSIDPPCPAQEILACKNFLIHLPAAMQGHECEYKHTPALFTQNSLAYDYIENAPDPIRWIKFLKEIWPDDQQAIDALQEWFGYCLLPDTRQQKILMIIGPKRAGKGTLAHVLRGVVGEENVSSPTLASLTTNFGLAPLLGKSVAIISDARLSGRTDVAVVTERLLSISGEDPQNVDRKNKAHVAAKLLCRFVILTNELPRLNDPSGALASRLVLLRMTQSWIDKEDTRLTEKLLAELPSILLWAIAGLKRLHERGHFVQPKKSAEVIQQMEDLSSPIGEFVRELCDVGPAHEVFVRDIFGRWKDWCLEVGRKEPGTEANFGKDLRAFVPGIDDCRPRVGESRPRKYIGIRLKPPPTWCP